MMYVTLCMCLARRPGPGRQGSIFTFALCEKIKCHMEDVILYLLPKPADLLPVICFTDLFLNGITNQNSTHFDEYSSHKCIFSRLYSETSFLFNYLNMDSTNHINYVALSSKLPAQAPGRQGQFLGRLVVCCAIKQQKHEGKEEFS